MNHIRQIISCIVLASGITASAQLAVTVSPPKIAGQRAVVELKMKNKFDESVKSARAICFLLDDKGKMVGESAKWVIGGTKNQPSLEPKKETAFNIVITSPRPFAATNLTAKVSFSRLMLESGKSINPNEEVTIAQQLPSTNQISPTNNLAVVKPLDSVIASASNPITIKPAPRLAGTIAVTNPLQPINHLQSPISQPK
jgi:hypothetical protein